MRGFCGLMLRHSSQPHTLLDEELLNQINARIAAAGREGFAKEDGAPLAALEVKVDPYVLETDVPFPTDLNLLGPAPVDPGL